MNRIAEALCAALREPRQGEADAPDVASLTPAEWHQVAALAIRQRAGPLLLSRNHLPFPDDVRALLRARAESSARRVLLQQAAFRELAGAVAPLGISLVALKGLHLASAVYPSAALREMNDIDVLVRPEHVETVSTVARELGYRPLIEIPVPIALKAMYHAPLFLKGRVGLEVHWRLGRPDTVPLVEPEELWAMTSPTPMAANALTLPLEALLVHVCVHAGTHQLEQGMRPLCDVQAIITRSDGALSWPRVAELARRWNCERSVMLVLSLTHAALGVQIPDEVMDALSVERPSSAVLSVALAHVLADTSEIDGTSQPAGALLSTPGPLAKLRHIRDRIWLPDEFMATLYPNSGTGPLARAGVTARRISDVIRRHAWGLLRLATQKKSSARSALDRRNALVAWLRGR
jgi:hypothetical protein